MKLLFLIPFALLPSFIWLFFFLHKDSDHPEPKVMILRTFVLGMLITLPAAFIELFLGHELNLIPLPNLAKNAVSIFITVALVEEALKYFIMRKIVMKTKYFDEPMDAMIYPIVIALGFAALENILAALTTPNDYVSLIVWRFVSATLIHALSASVWGYFIALAHFLRKPRFFMTLGLVLGTIVHGTYNLIVGADNYLIFNIFFPLLILPVSFIVAMEFRRLHYGNPENKQSLPE